MAKGKEDKGVKVDFSGVDKEIKRGSGKAAHLPEDDFLFKVVKAELRDNKNNDGQHYSWRMQVVGPKSMKQYIGKGVYHTTSLKPEALWNLRNLIHACTGKNVAGKKGVAFDPTALYGKVFAATTVDDEYNDKVKSVLEDIRPESELKDKDAAANDAPASGGKKKKKSKKGEKLEEVEVDEL